MRKSLLTFENFISEQEDTINSTGTTPSPAPETEREAKSRIAAGLVKSLFGDIAGLTGGIDSQIEVTPEIKDSLPYKGCGATEPFKIEKTPIPVNSFKIILEYLQGQNKGDYSRSIKELEENRAVIVGIRNRLSIKKESINQDRFIDALYFIPGGIQAGPALAAKESIILKYSEYYKMYEADQQGITPYQITTVPSLAYYGKKPLNPKGTGIKLPGDTLFYLKDHKLGHGTYKMMVEGEKVKVGRYPIGVTKFETYKPAEVFTENCGMEIHRSSTKGEGICVGPWSAGCQVFSDYEEWKEFIAKAEKEQMNNGKFIYALIQLDDVPDDVMNNAIKGIASNVQSEEPVKSDEVGNSQIPELASFIKSEKEKTNSDEEAVIAKYNSIVRSESDLENLLSQYGPDLWDDLDSFLSSSELEQLNFRDKEST